MDDQEYAVWQRQTRMALDTQMGVVKDEIVQIRSILGYDVQRETPMPHVELEQHKTPEAARFWGSVEDMRFGTVWNQPKIGDKVLYGELHGEVIELIMHDTAVAQARVKFVVTGENKALSILVEPWKLEKDNE